MEDLSYTFSASYFFWTIYLEVSLQLYNESEIWKKYNLNISQHDHDVPSTDPICKQK